MAISQRGFARLAADAVAKSGKEAFLALAGSWKDDPDIDQIVRESMRRRGRSIDPGPDG